MIGETIVTQYGQIARIVGQRPDLSFDIVTAEHTWSTRVPGDLMRRPFESLPDNSWTNWADWTLWADWADQWKQWGSSCLQPRPKLRGGAYD